METFSALLAICAGIHRSPVNSPHRGQWRRALMFSLICVWINSWVNNCQAGDLRRYRAHYDVTVMSSSFHPKKGVCCHRALCLRLTHHLNPRLFPIAPPENNFSANGKGTMLLPKCLSPSVFPNPKYQDNSDFIAYLVKSPAKEEGRHVAAELFADTQWGECRDQWGWKDKEFTQVILERYTFGRSKRIMWRTPLPTVAPFTNMV